MTFTISPLGSDIFYEAWVKRKRFFRSFAKTILSSGYPSQFPVADFLKVRPLDGVSLPVGMISSQFKHDEIEGSVTL